MSMASLQSPINQTCLFWLCGETKADAKDSMQTLYSAAHQEITNQEPSRCKVTLLHGGAVVNTS